MPYDPTTFENLYPYPKREAIRDKINNEILDGKTVVPKEYLLDTSAWIKRKVDEIFNAERKKYDESEGEAVTAWQLEQEEDYGFSKWPQTLKHKIHSYCWEKGHSGGYSDVQCYYSDIVELVGLALDIGKKNA